MVVACQFVVRRLLVFGKLRFGRTWFDLSGVAYDGSLLSFDYSSRAFGSDWLGDKAVTCPVEDQKCCRDKPI